MPEQKRIYGVTLPIGGHAYVSVVASSEEEATKLAKERCAMDDIQSWDIINSVNEGNVCYFPEPWEITVEDEGDADETP